MKKLLGLIFLIALTLGLACSDSGEDIIGSTDPTLSVSDDSVTEGEELRFIVTLSAVSDEDVSFSWGTVNGTATLADYDTDAGTDTIFAGATADTIDITTIDDAIVENSETITIGLGSAVNATIAAGSGTGTILDNDASAVSFASDVRPILVDNCAVSGCHGSGSSQGGFSFGTLTYDDVRDASGFNGAIISAGDASSSSLYTKTTSSPPFGGRMPSGGRPALSTADQEKIRDWINEGAIDN